MIKLIRLQIIICGFFGFVTAKTPLPTPIEVPIIGELDAYFLKNLYQLTNVDTGLAHISDQKAYRSLLAKHDIKLLGGPMLGCVTDKSARIWVRTPKSSQVQLVLDNGIKSSIKKTTAQNDYVAVLSIDGLEAETSYTYDVLVDGQSVLSKDKPKLTTYASKGTPQTITVGFGGCARYNDPKERIWDIINGHELDAFLFLGDNIYADLPEDRTKQRVHYYRRQFRPEFRRLVSETPIYAIWDDHDFGANDVAGGVDKYKPSWKPQVLKVFKENWNNPYYGGGVENPGCWFDFSIGDVDFFMLDTRYYRDFKNQKTMLGEFQKQWLLEKLKTSTASFKVIASSVLWTELADKGGKDSWWGVKHEREEVFSFIEKHAIDGVVLLSSDRHRTDVYKIKRPNGYDFYEFESGNLTNDHMHKVNVKALFSLSSGNFFGLLTFNFDKEHPEIIYQARDIDNNLVFQMPIKLSQLKSKVLRDQQ